MLSKKLKHIRRKERTRFKLKSSNLDRLRLCFYTSNKYIYGQVIDESKRMTITSLATYDKDFKDFKNKNNIKAAELLGLNRNTLRKKVNDLDIRLMRLPR
jgi:ribosomal protein L18